jgi:hypothetical protein
LSRQQPIGAKANFLAELKACVAELQPDLKIMENPSSIVVEGSFVLGSEEGNFDQFEIRLNLSERFPEIEPKVFETNNRIPRIQDRHINPDGDCCITVWESWLVSAPDLSIRGYVQGPLREFFLNQWFFERKGKWRFGERAHGTQGMVDAYAEALGITANIGTVLRYLKSLATKPRGHLECPCGSGVILRKCHQQQLHQLYARLKPGLAKRMLDRLQLYQAG